MVRDVGRRNGAFYGIYEGVILRPSRIRNGQLDRHVMHVLAAEH